MKEERKRKELDEYIEYECSNCGMKMKQPKWLLDKYEKQGEAVYCSEECRYNAETSNPGEEY